MSKPVTMADSGRMQKLIARIDSAEARLAKVVGLVQKNKDDATNAEAVQRVKDDLLRHGIYSTRFYFVPPHYYELSLEQRAGLLGGAVPQLCKSILFENLTWEGDDEYERTNARYYCVVIQYVTKINTTTLRNLIHGLRPPAERLSKSRFNFQLTADAKSYELSGFEHNAIAPFGFRQAGVPMVVCSRLSELRPPLVFLGGGHVDAKLLIPVNDLIRSTNAIVGQITEVR